MGEVHEKPHIYSLTRVSRNLFDEKLDISRTYYVLQGIARLTEIPVKDVVIVMFMLCLWAYSIALIVRAWAKVNLNAGVQGE